MTKLVVKRFFENEKQKLLSMINRFYTENLVTNTSLFLEKWQRTMEHGTWKHIDHHLQQFGV